MSGIGATTDWADMEEKAAAASPTHAHSQVRAGPTVPTSDPVSGTQSPTSEAADQLAATHIGETKSSGGLNPHDDVAKVHVQGGSPDDAYQAAQSFEELGLSPELLNGVKWRGYTRPSKIQAQALPYVVNGHNVIGQAKHGSGKTAAYVLSMLSRIDESKAYAQAMCVCPTRELATQVAGEVGKLAKFTNIKCYLAVPQAENRTITEQIIVGTPGTLIAKQNKQYKAKNMKVIVLDEADQMLAKGGFAEKSMRLKTPMPKNVQVLLFSATFNDRVLKFAQKFAPNAKIIKVEQTKLTRDHVCEFFIRVNSDQQRYQLLKDMYGLFEIGQSIIFVRTVAGAKQLANSMRKDDFGVSLLHGQDLSAAERDQVVKDFRESKTRVLIATNIIARGFDVPQVTMVANMEPPTNRHNNPDMESYIHRVGRAGRFGRRGVGLTFVSNDRELENIRQIERHFGQTITELPADDLVQIQERVEAALKQNPQST